MFSGLLPGFDPLQWLSDRLRESMQAVNNPLQPLLNFISTTNLGFTTQNQIVHTVWFTMATIAETLLALFIVIRAIQIMCGQNTGILRMPLGELVGKTIVTVVLIQLSAFIGEQLLIVNNLLCGAVQGNLQAFIQQFNNGQLFTGGQQALLTVIVAIVFGIGLFRVLFQALKRLIRFNVLFVLSGFAFLFSFHPATAPFFTAWARMYGTTIFEQFVQFLTFGLGIQFVLASKQTGLTEFILAAAMLNMTAEIPSLLARLSATSSSVSGGLGNLIATGIKVGMVLG